MDESNTNGSRELWADIHAVNLFIADGETQGLNVFISFAPVACDEK